MSLLQIFVRLHVTNWVIQEEAVKLGVVPKTRLVVRGVSRHGSAVAPVMSGAHVLMEDPMDTIHLQRVAVLIIQELMVNPVPEIL
jgi:hypothetical protein